MDIENIPDAYLSEPRSGFWVAEIDGIIRGMVAVSAAIQELDSRQSNAHRDEQTWRSEFQGQIAEAGGLAAAAVGTAQVQVESTVAGQQAVEPLMAELVEGDRHVAYGAFGQDIASGLKLRHDHGSQFVADDFQRELAFLGIAPSPAFVREPEGNGCAERFIRTLKENLLWVRPFETVEELRLVLLEFQTTYNEHWLIERHGHRSPAQFRRDQMDTLPMAA